MELVNGVIEILKARYAPSSLCFIKDISRRHKLYLRTFNVIQFLAI